MTTICNWIRVGLAWGLAELRDRRMRKLLTYLPSTILPKDGSYSLVVGPGLLGVLAVAR